MHTAPSRIVVSCFALFCLAFGLLALPAGTASAAPSSPISTEAELGAAITAQYTPLIFAPGALITLTAPGMPGTSKNIDYDAALEGNSATSRAIIRGNNTFRLFHFQGGLTSISNLIFENGGGSNDGAAIHLNGGITGGISNSAFNNNTTTGNGGALCVGTGGLAGGIIGSDFTGNSAGEGGALFTNGDLVGDISNSTFIANQATRYGGAIFTWSDVNIHGAGTRFTGNKALGEAATPYSGLGGAIFHNAVSETLQSNNFTLSAKAGNPIIFSGNTHNPGGSGETPNSIYFGNYAPTGKNGTVVATFNVAAGGALHMLDPLSSQADNFASKGNVDLTINKIGSGAWVLAGHNYMQSATDWTVSEGSLHLVADSRGNAAHINLANLTSASFTLKSGATLLLAPATAAHQINGQSITLESGSRVGMQGFWYGSRLNGGQYTVLTLDAPTSVDNQSSLTATSGVISVGAYDYPYSDLAWNGVNLVMTMGQGSLNPVRGGVPAVVAPTAVITQLPATDAVFGRLDSLWAMRPRQDGAALTSSLTQSALWRNESASSSAFYQAKLFGGQPSGTLAGFYSALDTQSMAGQTVNRRGPRDHTQGLAADGLSGAAPLPRAGSPALGAAPGVSWAAPGSGGIWVTPSYGYIHQNSGGDRMGYDVSTPGISLGADAWVSERILLGAAVSYASSDYDGRGTDITADSVTGTLYGGFRLPWEFELGLSASYTGTSYDQDRKVYGEKYSSDYDSTSWNLAAGLGRSFTLTESWRLRPGLRYEYLHMDIDGYGESNGTYALKFKSHTEELHRLQAGADLIWAWEDKGYVSGGLYYLGNYGDTDARARAVFAGDPGANAFTTKGEALDRHAVGLTLQAGMKLAEDWTLSAGYGLGLGENSTGQQGMLTLEYSW